MIYWVGLPRAVERYGFKIPQPMVAQLKPWMLAGHEQGGRLAKGSQGMGNGTELDGFGTRSNNERNTILAQLSP
jgi:hypothetical protein